MSWYTPIEEVLGQKAGKLNTWSFSTLKNFETCPHKVFVSHVLNIKEEAGDAAKRGTVKHAEIESYIKGESDSLSAFKPAIRDEIENLRNAFSLGNAYIEQEIAFNREWTPVSWENRWGGFIIDAHEKESPSSSVIIDWKSGKSFGNELKHAEQLMFYANAVFLYDPEVEFIECKIGYIDEGKMALHRTFTREQMKTLHPIINTRALVMTAAETFPAQPSLSNCKYCTYKSTRGPDGELLCPYGVV